ncbi:MAG: dihydrofolate reductase family protein [Mucilaginibacter polytrichastri]|nr:dihydrofolate reductase family protein [Mucilaginibacter polytrichastri]
MRKLKVQMQITLDGFVASPDGGQDWVWISGFDPVGFQKIVELAESSDTLLLGRKMSREFIDHWENMLTQDGNPVQHLAPILVNMRKIVFSGTETSIAGRNVSVENGDLATAVRALKEEDGKDILVYGGAEFVRSLINANLVDEYNLVVNPVAIGSGMPIFTGRNVMKLVSSTPFKSGKILNTYVPV